MTFGSASKVKLRCKCWSLGVGGIPELPVAWLGQPAVQCLVLPLFSARANSLTSAYSLSSGIEQEFCDGEGKRERRWCQGESKPKLSSIQSYTEMILLFIPKSWIWTHQLEKRCLGQCAVPLLFSFKGRITPVLAVLEDVKSGKSLSWLPLNAPLGVRVVTQGSMVLTLA